MLKFSNKGTNGPLAAALLAVHGLSAMVSRLGLAELLLEKHLSFPLSPFKVYLEQRAKAQTFKQKKIAEFSALLN